MDTRFSTIALAALLLCPAPANAAPAPQFAAHRDFPAGYGPASIAVADVNGDGQPDIVSANHLDDTVGVLLGKTDGTFQPPRSIYIGSNASPRSVAVSDFNRDGLVDVAVAASGLNSIVILAGNGDGTFQASGNFPAGTTPTCLVANDFTADGLPDLVAVSTGSDTVSLLIGNGGGTFQPPRTLLSGAGASFVAVGNLNADGRPDLAIAESTSGSVATLLSNGDGTFQAPLISSAGPSVWSVAIGDFNRDGAQDLAAADNGADTVSILLGTGHGTFQQALSFVAGHGPTSVAIADFTGDGIADLAVGNERDGSLEGSNTVSVLAGDGMGAFSAPRTFAVGTMTWSVAVGNFNGDGAQDLAVANTYSTTVSVLLGNGDGTFPAALSLPVGHNPEGLASGDVNGDGKLDLVASNAGSNTVSVMLGLGDGTFTSLQPFAAGSVPVFAALGDLNGDGKLDLLLANYGSHDYYNAAVDSTVSVLLGNGDGTFQTPSAFEAGAGPHGIALGDFNRDGIQDLAVADLGPYPVRATTVAVLIGRGDGTFGAPTIYNAGSGPTGVATGDFNGDGALDLAVTCSDDGTVAVLLNAGGGGFLPAVSFPVGNVPKSVSVADMNGDRTLDLVVTDHYSDTVSVLAGNGDGTFAPRLIAETGRNPAWVAIGDIDGDLIPDLAVANWFSTSVSILIGKGDGTFWKGLEFGAAAAAEKSLLADFNGDGRPDVAVANYFASSVSVLINRTGLTRAAAPVFSPAGGSYVGSVTVSLSSATSGAVIHYTMDGSTPTASSPFYATPISLTRTTTLRATAMAAGMLDSAESDATYTLYVAAPVFSVPGGTYSQTQSVSLSTATSGAVIHYTVDGSTPTAASPTYSSPIAITRSTALRAIAMAAGMSDSAIATATYTLQPATPIYTPPSGHYVTPQFVEISSASPGATIYYTTDGSTPTAASTKYTGAILVAVATTIRSVAIIPGWSTSTVATASYTILIQ